MKLPVQRIDERIFDALGIVTRYPYGPVLGDVVVPTVSIPLGIGSESSLGFNDGETDSDSTFVRWATQGLVAGQFAHVQLLNPSGSGRVFYLDEVACWDPIGVSSFNVAIYSTALTLMAVPSLYNARLGASSGAVEVRGGNNVALLGTVIDRVNAAAANEQVLVAFDPPLRLDPGIGIVFANITAARAMDASIKGREYNAA